MLSIPQPGLTRIHHNLAVVGATTLGTAVTTGASSSTKGSAVQLIASSNFDATWVTILASGIALSGAASDCCLDILTGAATEDVLIANLLAGGASATGSGAGSGLKQWDFPLFIPAGTRIAAQAASSRTSASLTVGVVLYGGRGSPAHRVGSKVVTYGIGTVPNGTSVTAGTSAAQGAWTEIASSTSEDHFAFVPSLQSSDAAYNSGGIHLAMGTGAATEQLIGDGYHYGLTATETFIGPYISRPTFQDVPSGTRLVTRLSGSMSSPGAGLTVAIHGVG